MPSLYNFYSVTLTEDIINSKAVMPNYTIIYSKLEKIELIKSFAID